MDSNGLRFWMLSTKDDWIIPPQSDASVGVYYCAERKRLQLRSVPDDMAAEDYTAAAKALAACPFARDQFGNYARWAADAGHVMAGGSGEKEIAIYAPPSHNVTDLALGFDGVLYVAVDGQIALVDRRNRWPDFLFPVKDAGKTLRLAAHPAGGIVALDVDNRRLLRIEGLPLGDVPECPRAPGVMAACDENLTPPRVTASVGLPANEYFVGIADNGQGQFALLSWNQNDATNDAAWIRTFTAIAELGKRVRLWGAKYPYSVAWLEDSHIALLLTQNKKAVAFDLTQQYSDEETGKMTAPPLGESYVVADVNPGPFAHGFTQPPQYNLAAQLFPLVPLSLNSLTKSGEAVSPIFDSGSSRAAWHRVYVECVLPPTCGVIVWLGASEDPRSLDPDAEDVKKGVVPPAPEFPHVFGNAQPEGSWTGVPKAVWLREASEVPFHPGLLGQELEPDRVGLFMALVQRAGRAVRTLRGRYLRVRVQLFGDHRSTPQVAAVRVYGPRFSYVEHYLPEIYREDTFGPDADVKTDRATNADFFERFINIFESPLTQMEDRVASAYLLTDPDSAPDDDLDWVGSWIGVEPGPEPPDRRRARLQATPALYRKRGTIAAVEHALDVATGGLHQRGAVIVIEDYRLRHTFATVLGANLAPKDDPLLPGHWESSNSFVGDTLFLGDEHKKEFLSLYSNALQTLKEEQDVTAFFADLANRITVFMHEQVEFVDQQVVRRVVEREKPAHVAASYLKASQPFLVGLASLLGVNTYLSPPSPRKDARVDGSAVGDSFIGHPAALDPRFGNAAAAAAFDEKLIARISGPNVVALDSPIVLDGSASSVVPPGTIGRYTWSVVKGPDS